MNKSRYSLNIIYLSVLFFIEIFTLFKPKFLGFYFNPIIMSTAGILFCKKAFELDKETYALPSSQNIQSYYDSKVFFLLSGFMGLVLFRLFQDFPINPSISDIIPATSVVVKRFIKGEFPYAPIGDFGWTILPNYFTFRWLPFVFAELVNLDYRWLVYFIFLISILFYNHFLSRQNLPQAEYYIKLTVPFAILYLFAVYHPIAIGATIELMDAAFYLLLAFAIFSKSNIFRGVALSICLLSRFSLIFWTPLYLWIIFLTEDKKNLFKVVSTMVVMGMVFYILPFLAKDPTILTNSFKYYKIGILGEWKGQGWQQPGDKPFSIFQGLGFASYFYNFVAGDLSQKISKLQYTQLIFCISTLVLSGILFFRNRNNINARFYSILALKFYLIFFYAFVQVPYPYLFIIPVFISIYIISYFAWNLKKTQEYI